MTGIKILVLGATGPAGLLLLRELLHRQHGTIAYVRNASKIPADLASSPLLQRRREDNVLEHLLSSFPPHAQNDVKRILAMGTLSITEDSSSFTRLLQAILTRIIASTAYNAVIDLGHVFQEEADGLDRTLFHISFISGEPDEDSWRADREDQPTYAGYIAKPGWKAGMKRAALASWLFDEIESGKWSKDSEVPTTTSRLGFAIEVPE
ncbi:hypothetical protein CABS01_10464 [Colletotrichum abscissum]|uniref:NAD(P)-binding domain-containing protein n=1 Tax=Colletotrichum abscissum TaxID=1671311 RepID=A0A9Q0B4W6_9PEZI|nr:uncharacterized protein CABS01_10464 [Colletotrichum abscissum]KAI3550020.1 hypothetical protein CABS02_07708 [Colletotrichum abscissum]KAK1498689.1 hypothetical protein CABS01_10464 [Colletotrichum abscissum]